MLLVNRRNKNGLLSVKIILALSIFFLGFVFGMLTIHFVKQKEINELQESLDTAIAEKTEEKVYNVYIPERSMIYGKVPVNPYNVDNFKIMDGFMAYVDDDGNKISHLGVDLSYHNKSVDFDALAASGIEFVMLRCGYRGYTEGGLVKDEKFDEYAAEANRVGLKLGVYFFTQAVTMEEAHDEAEFVIDLIKDYDISYPVAIDTEHVPDSGARTNENEISDELRTQMIIEFCKTVSEEGYYPMIYASENWMRRNMDLSKLTEYDFWVPQYLDENDFLFDFTIWQYTEAGYAPGIDGEVDLDISMVDYASFVPQLREAVLNNGKIVQFPELN